jgi:hypothetical protein
MKAYMLTGGIVFVFTCKLAGTGAASLKTLRDSGDNCCPQGIALPPDGYSKVTGWLPPKYRPAGEFSADNSTIPC